MAITLLTYAILILTIICVVGMIYRLKQQPAVALSPAQYIKIGISGVVAFIGDTLGVGSFAVNVAMAKLLGTFSDDELPAVNNGAQVIPGVFESLFFMQIVDVDLTTLLMLIAGTCIGGVVGGSVVSRLSKQAIRLTMVCCFTFIIGLLLARQFHFFPSGGEVNELHSWKLLVGFGAMIICGSLSSAGIGLFVMVQGVLFLLGVSPLVAFPIMTTAGAMQQPLTTLVFLKHNKIPLKKTLVLSLSGCLGVFITLPLFAYLTTSWLHNLLLIILTYNLFAMGRAYLKARPSKAASIEPYLIAP